MNVLPRASKTLVKVLICLKLMTVKWGVGEEGMGNCVLSNVAQTRTKSKGVSSRPNGYGPRWGFSGFSFSFSIFSQCSSFHRSLIQGCSSTISEMTLNMQLNTQGVWGQGCSTCWCTQDSCRKEFANRVSADPTLGQGPSSVLRVPSESNSPALPSTSSCSCFRPESPSQALLSWFNGACVDCPSGWEHTCNFSAREILILSQKLLCCASEYTMLVNYCHLRCFYRFGWNTRHCKCR